MTPIAEDRTYPVLPILIEIDTGLPGLLPVIRKGFVARIRPIVIYLMNYTWYRWALQINPGFVISLGDLLLGQYDAGMFIKQMNNRSDAKYQENKEDRRKSTKSKSEKSCHGKWIERLIYLDTRAKSFQESAKYPRS